MNDERNRRWRLLLGTAPEGTEETLSRQDAAMDAALAALYDNQSGDGQKRHAGLGASAPRVARWLGDIRTYFPSRVVQVMQADAIDRLGLKQLLLEPEMLETVEADVHLVATLAGLGRVMPQKARASAREVVARVVKQVEEKLADKVQQAVRGALNRAARTNRPRLNDINWLRTIEANLGNYLPELNTVVPERLIGYGRKQTGFPRGIRAAEDEVAMRITPSCTSIARRPRTPPPGRSRRAGARASGAARPWF